jgi:hypothetical protein
MTPHPWDDLEQDFLRFTITVKEMANSIATMVDEPGVPAETIDSVQNTVNGLIEYVKTTENTIADAMEGKISYDYGQQSFQQTSWITTIDDDWTIKLTKWVSKRLNWSPGDLLRWEITNDNNVVVKKLDK